LGLVAGLLILAVGLWMLVGRIRGKEPFHFHSHDHDHDHKLHEPNTHNARHTHEHEHGRDIQGVAVQGERRVGLWQLFVLGVSGGLVPCPAAIAILLAAVAAGRLGEGLTYILLFSVGLATVLIAVGMIVVSAGKLASRFLDAKKFARKISIVSAAIITLIGVATVANSLRHVV
jgi:nickel/cobalt exporter